MNMNANINLYIFACILTHLKTEINIILSVLYVIPERDVPILEYVIDSNVKSRDWLLPKWNIFNMSIINLISL